MRNTLLFALFIMPLMGLANDTQEKKAAFFHDQVEQMMQQDEVANAVIAVVVNGELIFSNGYGFTDTSSNDTVD
ncbi:MAG: hypothetical protein ACOC12_05400, partial [Bacteroidota bacterium]